MKKNDSGAGLISATDTGHGDTLPRPSLGDVLTAANNADWQQVVLNGGPPCFHFDAERGRFCLAAERWAGHGEFHPFTGLADMIGLAVYNANLSVNCPMPSCQAVRNEDSAIMALRDV